MKPFERTIETPKPFDEAVAAVEREASEKGFRVLHTHDVAGTLAEKGFAREPLKIIEICNSRYAHEVLQKDIRTALMLPCPIAVYVERGKTYISTLLPSTLVDYFPDRGIAPVATKVEGAVLEIIHKAAGLS